MSMPRLIGLVLGRHDITASEFRILATLAFFENDRTGLCYPSQDRIANECNTSRSYVNKVISGLLESGLVQIVKNEQKSKSGHYNSYRLNWEKIHRDGDGEGATLALSIVPKQGGKGANMELSNVPFSDTIQKTIQKDTEEVSDISDAEVDSAHKVIWELASKKSRGRSSEKLIKAALKAKKKKGIPLADIVTGWEAYTDSYDAKKNGGEFMQGPHTWIGQERYATFLEDRPPSPPTAAPGRPFRLTDTTTSDKQEIEAQRFYIDRFAKHGNWGDNLGPRPDEDGCQFRPELLKEFGYVHNSAPPVHKVAQSLHNPEEELPFD